MQKKSEWQKFHERIQVVDSGCWKWTGSYITGGYGCMTAFGKKAMRAHRIAYELYKGPIPDKLFLDHLCRNRWCVNPEHVEPVTNEENILRGHAPSILIHHSGCCANGHPINKQNTVFRKQTGDRKKSGQVHHCKICRHKPTEVMA